LNNNKAEEHNTERATDYESTAEIPETVTAATAADSQVLTTAKSACSSPTQPTNQPAATCTDW